MIIFYDSVTMATYGVLSGPVFRPVSEWLTEYQVEHPNTVSFDAGDDEFNMDTQYIDNTSTPEIATQAASPLMERIIAIEGQLEATRATRYEWVEDFGSGTPEDEQLLSTDDLTIDNAGPHNISIEAGSIVSYRSITDGPPMAMAVESAWVLSDGPSLPFLFTPPDSAVHLSYDVSIDSPIYLPVVIQIRMWNEEHGTPFFANFDFPMPTLTGVAAG